MNVVGASQTRRDDLHGDSHSSWVWQGTERNDKDNYGTDKVLTWVTVRPFLKSTYLPSMSPLMTLVFESRLPATLKVTLEGVRVLTSREVPWMG